MHHTYTPAHTRSKLEYIENLKKARNRILPKIENAARAGPRQTMLMIELCVPCNTFSHFRQKGIRLGFGPRGTGF